MTSDEEAVRKLDERWNQAYQQHRRADLRAVLAEDWLGFFPDGNTVTRETLIAATAPAGVRTKFSDFSLHLYGSTAVTRGRVKVTLNAEVTEQRFMRVWAKRADTWAAVAVQVYPVN